MPTPPRKVATSYDEIVRNTVIDPDGSIRPTKEQVSRAYEGARHLTDEEQELYARVSDALLGVDGLDVSHVDIEIDRDRVTLRGAVADAPLLSSTEDVVRGVDGVGSVINQLVVAVS